MSATRAVCGCLALVLCTQQVAPFVWHTSTSSARGAMRQSTAAQATSRCWMTDRGAVTRHHWIKDVAVASLTAAAAGRSLAPGYAGAEDGSSKFRNRLDGDGGAVASTVPRPDWVQPEVTSRGFLTVSIDGKPAGTLKFELYGKDVPVTVKNFESLLTGNNEGGYNYKGTTFYRVVQGLNMQAGAIGDANLGRSGVSSTGQPFGPENFNIKHKAEGVLSMVKDMKGTNDSRFFITLKEDAGWADGRYVAFGRVTEGSDLLREIDSTSTSGSSNRPKKAIVIEDCGLLDT